MIRTTAAAAIGTLVAGLVSLGTQTSHASAPCTDSSRRCVIATAMTYLDALADNDAAHIAAVRFAPDVTRTENGLVTGSGAAELRSNLASYPLYRFIDAIQDIRWVVEGDEADAYYLIQTGAGGAVPAHTATAHVAERFTVRHGLITNLEAIFCFAGGPTPERASQTVPEGQAQILCLRMSPAGV